jgi:transglutaminase superfamily protein
VTRSARFVATVGRRTRLAASLVASPADAWLALRMAGWRLVLPLMKRRLPLTRLVRLMWRGERARQMTPEREARIADLARVVYRSEHVSRPGNCLERSLVLYRYLSAAGADPQLVVGIRSGEPDVRGHAWITVRGEAVEEPPDSLDGLTQLVSFSGDGSRPRSRRVSEAVRAAP